MAHITTTICGTEITLITGDNESVVVYEGILGREFICHKYENGNGKFENGWAAFVQAQHDIANFRSPKTFTR